MLPSSILYICCIFALLCPVLLLQVRACQAEDAHQELRQVVASSEAAVKQVCVLGGCWVFGGGEGGCNWHAGVHMYMSDGIGCTEVGIWLGRQSE